MIIGHPRKTSIIEVYEQMRLNGLEIKRVANTKSLGIIVDEGLNWEQQFKTVYNKSRGGLDSLKRLKNIFSQSSLSNVYRALVESNMRYADVIWGNLSNSKIESLQRLQDRIKSVMVYKILNQLCPENLRSKFHLRSDYSRYNTRFCRNIQIPKYNLAYAKKGFSYSALKTWNEIPLNIREIPTLNHFKKQLKIYLMS